LENKIEIYKTRDGKTALHVKFDKETIWLNQSQIADLFERERSVVTKHINNVFREGELNESEVCAKFAHTTKHGAIKGKTQESNANYYNLDVIISVGYRVKSIRGTQFRQWATQRLKEYLIQGYSINQKRLDELKRVVTLIEQSSKTDNVHLSEAKGLLEILGNYTRSFILLNQYDSQTLPSGALNENVTYEIQYQEAKEAISELKKQLISRREATELFGKEKDGGFESSLKSIVQTFDGKYLYPSIEEQAANLLYFVIKNHSFNDGNKRIGAFLFVWFLEKNKHRFKKSGELKINDNGLTALALLLAQSKSEEKELMIRLVINLING